MTLMMCMMLTANVQAGWEYRIRLKYSQPRAIGWSNFDDPPDENVEIDFLRRAPCGYVEAFPWPPRISRRKEKSPSD